VAPPTTGVPVLVYPQRVRVLCVGGGEVAAGKVAGLMQGGAHIRVVAPDVVPVLQAAAGAGDLQWVRRHYQRGDVGDAHLVIAGTSDTGVNASVAADADAAGRLCVRVDRAAGGTAALMGAVHRDPLVLGVSTSGVAPGLTRLLRRQIEEQFGPEYGQLAMLWGELRADERVRETLGALDPQARRTRWRATYRPDILDLIRAGELGKAKKAALACLLSS
jgi:precorrin-2 dehydrogenase / sirohydrochlorin ferrochelatase